MDNLPSSLTMQQLLEKTKRRREIIESSSIQHQTSELFDFRTSILAGLHAEFGDDLKVYFSPWKKETRAAFNDVWYSDTTFRKTCIKVKVNRQTLTELSSYLELDWDTNAYNLEDLTNAWSIAEMAFDTTPEQFANKPSLLLRQSALALTIAADKNKFLHELRKQFGYVVETLVKDELSADF